MTLSAVQRIDGPVVAGVAIGWRIQRDAAVLLQRRVALVALDAGALHVWRVIELRAAERAFLSFHADVTL